MNFSGWSGDASGTENTTITMNEDKVVTATFVQQTLVPEFSSALLLSVLLTVLAVMVVAVRNTE